MIPFQTYLDRYIAKSFVLRFLVALSFALLISYMTVSISFFKKSEAVENFLTTNLMILLELPAMTDQVLPFCILLASFSCFFSHARSSEIIVMRSIGLSVWRILYPILTAALLITLVQITLVDWLGIQSKHLGYKIAQQERQKKVGPQLAASEAVGGHTETFSLSGGGIWLHENIPSLKRSMIAHIKGMESKKNIFHRVYFFIFLENGKFEKLVQAQEAELENREWHLKTVTISTLQDPIQTLEKYDLPTTFTRSSIQTHLLDPALVSLFRLPRFIQLAKKVGFSTKEYEIRLYSLLFLPLLSLLMVTVGAIFTMRSTFRDQSIVWNALGTAGSSFFIIFTRILFFALCRNNLVPTVLAILLPILVFGLIALWALFHLEDG